MPLLMIREALDHLRLFVFVLSLDSFIRIRDAFPTKLFSSGMSLGTKMKCHNSEFSDFTMKDSNENSYINSRK